MSREPHAVASSLTSHNSISSGGLAVTTRSTTSTYVWAWKPQTGQRNVYLENQATLLASFFLFQTQLTNPLPNHNTKSILVAHFSIFPPSSW